MASEEEIAHENVRAIVLEEVGLRHPNVFDTFSLCETAKYFHSAFHLRTFWHWDDEHQRTTQSSLLVSCRGTSRGMQLSWQLLGSVPTVRLKEKTYKWREIRPATFINFVYSYYSVEHYTWCPSYSTMLKIVPASARIPCRQNPSDTYFITYFFPGFHNFGPGNKYLMEGWSWDLGRWKNSQGFFDSQHEIGFLLPKCYH